MTYYNPHALHICSLLFGFLRHVESSVLPQLAHRPGRSFLDEDVCLLECLLIACLVFEYSVDDDGDDDMIGDPVLTTWDGA